MELIMNFPEKYIKSGIVMACLLWVVVSPVLAQETEAQLLPAVKPAQAMIVNLNPQPIDIQLGDKVVFSIAGLPSGIPSTLFDINTVEGQVLYFKMSAETTWRYFQDLDGRPQQIRFEPGTMTVFRVDRNGAVELIPMPAVTDSRLDTLPPASYCFFMNGTGNLLESIYLQDAAAIKVAEAQTVPAQAFTEVVAVNPGEYSGSWNNSDKQANKGLAEFIAGQKYIILVSDVANVPTINIWQLGSITSP
jgi:hypothetical protein